MYFITINLYYNIHLVYKVNDNKKIILWSFKNRKT